MRNVKAQSILEFTFAMIMALFFIYGLVQTAQWTLLTIAEQSGSGTKPARPVDAVWQKKAGP